MEDIRFEAFAIQDPVTGCHGIAFRAVAERELDPETATRGELAAHADEAMLEMLVRMINEHSAKRATGISARWNHAMATLGALHHIETSLVKQVREVSE